MFELLGAIASFIFLFIFPMLIICAIPALIAGGILVSMTDKENQWYLCKLDKPRSECYSATVISEDFQWHTSLTEPRSLHTAEVWSRRTVSIQARQEYLTTGCFETSNYWRQTMIEQYAYDICILLIVISGGCAIVFVQLAFEWLNSKGIIKKLHDLLDNWNQTGYIIV